MNQKKLKKAEPPPGPSAAPPAAVKRNSIQNFFKKLNPAPAKNSCLQTQNNISDDSGQEKTTELRISQFKDVSAEPTTTKGQKSNGDCLNAPENDTKKNNLLPLSFLSCYKNYKSKKKFVYMQRTL